ncbi:hypothetical protein DV735_g5427, partial [Chaetothyriales sp. CBS 134920]
MMASRSIKPKLSLSISTATASPAASRPALSLHSPKVAAHHSSLRSPIPPSPLSPTAYNTTLNQRGYSTMSHSHQQQPTYAYTNSSSSRSILKKNTHLSAPSSKSSSSATAASRRQLQFSDKPQVYCVTPIDDQDYYGPYAKMSKEERRWGSRR